ncbi:response regulator transcription factor [Clostridiaceae bacterium HSG29]|nr:response regulator transcription factor [Clostridiaceae bacterium HSG29]
MNKTILIVEDEKNISRFLELELTHEGYEVDKAYDGKEALEKLENNSYDLVVLDIMLPKINGMTVLRRLRKFSSIPVIMLTAKDDTMDKVMGLDSGADDYLTKPFEIEELFARIRVCLKHKKIDIENSNLLEFEKLKINNDMMSVYYNDNEINLTKKEYELLKFLLENKKIVLSRDVILNKVWGYDYFGDTNIVDVYIRYLRSKIDEKYDIKLIHTVRGVGYILKNE